MHKLYLLWLMECFKDAAAIIVVSDGMLQRCINYAC